MADLSDVTSLLPEAPQADCKLMLIQPWCLVYTNTNAPRFAFVEYEDRRDADDAYHEMHNKRIGRDDLLKIEVRHSWVAHIYYAYPSNMYLVGSHPSLCFLALRLGA